MYDRKANEGELAVVIERGQLWDWFIVGVGGGNRSCGNEGVRESGSG